MEQAIQVIVPYLIQALALVVSFVVLYFVRMGIKKLEEWTNVKISAAQQTQLEAIALQAVLYSEEAAMNALKRTKEKPDSELKLERAIAFSFKSSKLQGLPEPERGVLRKLILAKLQESRR